MRKITDPYPESSAIPSDQTVRELCPYYHQAIELLGKRWTGAIVWVLMSRPHRFSEIRMAIPELSDRLLSARIRELEKNRLVKRNVIAGPPIQVEYQLTETAHQLDKVLMQLQQWAEHWIEEKPFD